MIKKWIVGVCFIVGIIGSASADVNVDWYSSWGYTWTAGGASLLGDASGASCLTQLIWSPDATIGVADAGTAGYVTGNDVLLDSYILTEDSTPGNFDDYAYWSAHNYNDSGTNPDGGYIYGRIFQDNSVEKDDWYYDGVIVAATDWDPLKEPLDPAQGYEFSRSMTGHENIDGTFGGQVVPEPTTWALFALGAVVVGLRRRKK